MEEGVQMKRKILTWFWRIGKAIAWTPAFIAACAACALIAFSIWAEDVLRAVCRALDGP